MRRTRSENIFNFFNVTFMVLFSIMCIYPFIYILAISLNDATDSMRGGIYLFPRIFTLENYRSLFKNDKIVNAFAISVYRTVVGTILCVLGNASFAYLFTKKDLLGRKFFKWLIIIPMYIGGGLVPYFLILKNLHMVNNLFTYVIPSIYSTWNIMVISTFIAALPIELEESAMLDGAGYFRVFIQIVLPLSKPVLAAIALFSGVGQWNDWSTGKIFIFNEKIIPLSTLLYNVIKRADTKSFTAFKMGFTPKRSVTSESVKMAVMVVSTVPIICIYPFLQKYFVKGVLIGSIKG